MAIGSVLNPEAIVGKQNTNQQLAKNFISGGSFLGTSSITSAANKIVGFQRGTAQPAPSSISSIVSTISTNIANNITSTLNNTLQSFTADYKKRVSDVDSAKPTGVLSKFLSTYKNVIRFIQFFANKKFVNGISNNLKSLSKSFAESFEVAKLIRQVIVKIVQQLSNLPKATPGGGGGIDIDVDVPMGGVRKSAPRGLGNMFKGRGKMLALGAGALGVGALGAGAVNALSNVDEIRAGMFQPEDNGDIISTFGSAIERFIAAINTMVGIGKGSSKPPGRGSSGGGGGGSPGGPGPGGPSPNPNLMGGPGIEGLASFVAGAETGGRFDAYNSDSGKGDPKILDTNISDLRSYISKYPNSSGAVGAYQFMPETAEDLAKQMGIDPTKTKFTPEVQKQLHLFHLNQLGYGKYVKGEMSKEDFGAAIAQQYRAVPDPRTGYTWNDSAAVRNKAQVTNEQYLKALEQSKQGAIPGAPSAPVLPPPTSKPGIGGSYDELTPESAAAYKFGNLEQYKNLATNVSQPVQTAAQSQTNIIPIDLSGAMQQQSQGGGGGGVSAPPSTQKNGPSVPLLPSANTDNFLVLYSRMVYNIVDG